MSRRAVFLVLLGLGALIQTSPAPLRAWELGLTGFHPSPVQSPIRPLMPPGAADLKGDGRLETLAVTQGRATVFSGTTAVWQSPETWLVAQAAFTDLDHDGRPEATLLVWRPFQPWPIDRWLPYGGRIQGFHDLDGQSCHIILIGWRRGAYTELWAGSALADPIRAFAAADLDGNGRQELVTLEGTYADPRPRPQAPEDSVPAQRLKVWEWNGFGFNAVASIKGAFIRLTLVREANDHILILVP